MSVGKRTKSAGDQIFFPLCMPIWAELWYVGRRETEHLGRPVEETLGSICLFVLLVTLVLLTWPMDLSGDGMSETQHIVPKLFSFGSYMMVSFSRCHSMLWMNRELSHVQLIVTRCSLVILHFIFFLINLEKDTLLEKSFIYWHK